MMLALVAVLTGCTPSYTLQSLSGLSRETGLADTADIQRRAGYRLDRNSRLGIATGSLAFADNGALAQLIAEGFRPYFSHTAAIGAQADFAAVARQQRNNTGSDYLIFVESLRGAPVAAASGSDEAATDGDDDLPQPMELLFTIHDVQADVVIDKIQLHVDRGLLSPRSRDLAATLREPLTQLAQTLSGY